MFSTGWLKKILVFSLLLSLVFPPFVQAALGEFSIQDERELGQKFEVLITSRLPLVQDPVVLGYARDLLQKIQSALPAQPFELEINVLQDHSLNAFAAPAGKLFLHSGLILAMEDESELAAVLAHELAHVTQRHIAGNIERSKWISLGSLAGVLAGVLLGGGAGSQAVAMGSLAGGQAAVLKYSRDDEREADQLGLNYLVRAGYNPWGMAESFKKIRRHKLLGGSSEIPEYMLTHPGLEERIGLVENLIARMDPKTLQRQVDNSRLRKVQMLLRSRYFDPSRASQYFQGPEQEQSCLDILGKAIVQQRNNDMVQAERSFKKALQCGSEQALWQREVGRFYFQLGKFSESRPYLEKAIQLAPDDFLALYYLSRVRAAQGDAKQAAQGLQRVLRHLPRNHEVHTALGRVLGEQGDEFSGYLHYAYAHLYQNKRDRTEYYMQKAQELAKTRDQKQQLSEFKSEFEEVSQFW